MNPEEERRFWQQREDEARVHLDAEARHMLRVTLIGGLSGAAIGLAIIVPAALIWSSYWWILIGAALGCSLVMVGIFLAHHIDQLRAER